MIIGNKGFSDWLVNRKAGYNIMAQAKSNRSEARQSATNTAQDSGSTQGTGRRPGARPEGGSDAAAQPEAVAPAAPVPVLVIAPNPKRAGTIAHGFFEKYGPRHQMTTHADCLARGVRGKDFSWDRDPKRRHILIGDEATNFPLKGSREEQAAYLRKLDPEVFNDKRLIKWGYMDAPVEEAKTEEKATA